MMDELIAAVAKATSLSREQAALAVAAMLRFFTARLPSSLVGELHARLQTRVRGTAAESKHGEAPDDPESTI